MQAFLRALRCRQTGDSLDAWRLHNQRTGRSRLPVAHLFLPCGGLIAAPTPPLGYFYRNDGRVAQLKNKGGFCVVLLGVLMDFKEIRRIKGQGLLENLHE